MVGSVRHLARRFVWSLRAHAPDPSEERWLLDLLTRAEAELYLAQSPQDRRHSIDCAMAVRGDPDAPQRYQGRSVIVASALHDVGKAEVAMGTLTRALATVVAAGAGTRRVRAWSAGSGLVARMSRYRLHDERGAELLASAGSDPLVVAWAREHHERPERWSIDRRVGDILARADHR